MTARRLGPIGTALLIAIATRVLLFGIVWISLRAFPRFAPYPVQLPDTFLPDHPALDGWARWDTAHYVAVAQLGYGDPASPSPDGGIGFFPLFPLLMRAVAVLPGFGSSAGDYAVAGIVAANLCFLVAIVVLTRLGIEQIGEQATLSAVTLLCVAPFGFFFNAAYSESLFLMLVVLAVWFGNRDRWLAAGLAAGLASATRLVGLAVAPALLYLAYRRGAKPRDLATVALLSPSGFVAFLLYGWIEFDDPLAYFDAQAEWGNWNDHVWFYVELFATRPREALGGDPRHLIILVNVVLAALFLAFLPMVWRRLDPGTALLTTLLVAGQAAITWVSLGRYLMPAYGVFFVAGLLLTNTRFAGWPRDVIVIGGSLGLSLLAILFAHGFWVV